MSKEFIDLYCKIFEQITEHCKNCGDCYHCIYDGVFCNSNIVDGSFKKLPEDWDYELLRERLGVKEE